MKNKLPILAIKLIAISSIFTSLSVRANAEPQTIQMDVLSGSSKDCPKSFTATEKPQPYREGSFATDGQANLNSIATNIKMTSPNPFSVVWEGTLKPQFRKCKATAGISKVNGELYEGHSYVRMQFFNGKVYLILDVTGRRDANDYTLVILKKSLSKGTAIWQWGGTD